MPGNRKRFDPEDVRAAYEASRSGRDLRRRLGFKSDSSREAARRVCYEHGLAWPAPHWSAAHTSEVDIAPAAMPEGVASDAELVEYLKGKGYEVVVAAVPDNREWTYEAPPLDGQGTFKVGVVSDTHGGSRYAQRTWLEHAYDYFERHEIPLVLHAGDVTAGSPQMHPGIIYEQHAHGADQQAEYVCETYPTRPGITTKVISGNHDHSHLKAGGHNVVQAIAQQRPDIEYLGKSGAYVTINGIRIYLHHPSGGVAYARSYRLQKTIEQMSPENKPKVLIAGHVHVTCVLENYRNVYGFLAGCFEAQTPYLVEKGLSPDVGFSILTVEYDDDGAVSFTKTWKPCYVPREEDY